MSNLIGHSLGRYHILEQLGQGGMATVYKAYDTRLERDVAVKVLRTDQFAPATLERILKRFEREAKALARLTHPNIVPVIDYGEHEGAPYLVMPYLPGGTLKQRLGKPIPWQDALRLLLPVARALDYAHEHNILHRDVKPSNILLTEKNEPMLTDFGIAKILDLEDGQTLTATGVGVGTPEYMSPEQGLGKPVDARTDVYSLGVVLYELVTGRKPFQADTPMAVVLMQATEPLPRPTHFVPDLPEAVEKILLKALAKKPEDRYANMAEMAAAMEKIVVSHQSSVVHEEPSAVSRSPLPSGSPFGDDKGPGRRAEPVEAVRDDAATVDQAVTSATVLQEEDRRPQTFDRPPSTVHRPAGRQSPWKWVAGSVMALFLVIVGLTGSIGLLSRLGRLAFFSPTPAAMLSPTMTLTPTATPTPVLPVLSGTQVPFSGLPISAQQAEHIVQLARWGKGTVNQVAYSPDGHLLAVASSLGIYLYDAQTLQEVRFTETETWVNSVAFSPDGALLASGSRDSTVKLWRVADGALLHTLEGHTDWVNSVAFSPDGALLASGSNDGTVRLWRMADQRPIHILEQNASILDIAFSPDGKTLASSDIDGFIFIRNLPRGETRCSIKIERGVASSLSFSSDGYQLAGDTAMLAEIWDTRTCQHISSIEGPAGTFVEFSPDGRWLDIVHQDSSRITRIQATNWSIQDVVEWNALTSPLAFWQKDILDLDEVVLATGAGWTVRLWRAADGALLRTLEGQSRVLSVVFSPDGALLASGSGDSTVKLWRVADGALLRTLEEHTDWVWSVAFSPDGALLASGSDDGTVRLWGVR